MTPPPPPVWNFSKNSSVLVGLSFPKPRSYASLKLRPTYLMYTDKGKVQSYQHSYKYDSTWIKDLVSKAWPGSRNQLTIPVFCGLRKHLYTFWKSVHTCLTLIITSCKFNVEKNCVKSLAGSEKMPHLRHVVLEEWCFAKSALRPATPFIMQSCQNCHWSPKVHQSR